jgi:hypothetical protein
MDGFPDACAAAIASPRVGEHLTSHHGHPERVVEFAIREQTGIGRDPRRTTTASLDGSPRETLSYDRSLSPPTMTTLYGVIGGPLLCQRCRNASRNRRGDRHRFDQARRRWRHQSGLPTKAATNQDVQTSLRNVREMTKIAEHEIHAIVWSCARARRQMLVVLPATKPTLH